MNVLRNLGASGIHISFENSDVHILKSRILSEKHQLPFHVKIAGPGARNDARAAMDMCANGIISPMIESDYALTRFTSFAKHLDVQRGITIETRQGVDNLDHILLSQDMEYVDNICIGRSVLVSSYRTNRTYMNTLSFKDNMERMLSKIKNVSDISISMEGDMNEDAYDFIKYLHGKKLLDTVKTKNVMFKISKHFLENYKEALIEAEKFELKLKNEDFKNETCSGGLS